MKAIVITGVSTGIGEATAKILLANKYRVFGSVRKEEDAASLMQQFGDQFVPLILDVTQEHEVNLAAALVRDHLQGDTLAGLINNAGIILPSPLLHQSLADFRYQQEVNLIGPFIVTNAFLPLLGVDKKLKGEPGKIINISSVCGKFAVPLYGAYTASKHALEGYSDALRRELMLYGIDVVVIGPGFVRSAMQEKGNQLDMTPFLTSDYYPAMLLMKEFALSAKTKTLSADKIGQLILHILTAKHPKTRYSPVPHKIINWLIPRVLPKRWVDKALAKKFKLQKIS